MENKSELSEDKIPGLAEILGDEDKAKEIVEAAKASMGIHQIILFGSISVILLIMWVNFLQARIYPRLT